MMRPQFVDFHCHLDLYPDLANAITQCDSLRTATLAVTTTPKAFKRNKQLAAKSQFVRVALGLHPQLVADRHNEMKLFESLLSETRYVGEVGLDASPQFYKSFDLQKDVFSQILKLCADAGDKILSIHSLRCSKVVLDLIEEHLPANRCKVVLHWFTGTKSEAQRGVEMGCYFSVNENMLRSKTGKKVLEAIPENRLLTETDGPFTNDAGHTVVPGNVVPAVDMIARLRNCSANSVRQMVLKNLSGLVR